VSFGYDGRGNLTSSGVLSFGYNKENQLISGPNGTTIYDPLGASTNMTRMSRRASITRARPSRPRSPMAQTLCCAVM
jgi:hypothetical protein